MSVLLLFPVNVLQKRITLTQFITGRNEIPESWLRAVAAKYEIQQSDVTRLRQLKNFDVVILCDDSGPMMTPVDKTNTTRWNQLYEFVRLVVEISTILDSNGIDIHFLNRRDTSRITDPKQAKYLFDDPPSGFASLSRALRRIRQLPAARRGYDKKLLLFVATDGAPTNDNGDPNLAEFEHLVRHERQANTTHVMILIFTDDLEAVRYLREWDRTMENVDVTDDHRKPKRSKQSMELIIRSR